MQRELRPYLLTTPIALLLFSLRLFFFFFDFIMLC